MVSYHRNPILPRFKTENSFEESPRLKTLLSKIPRWVLQKIDVRHQILGPALDCGRDACVWEAANNRVVKITCDSFDAYTAKLVQEERPAGFIPIYDVYAIPGTASNHFRAQLFVIVSQKVEPLRYGAESSFYKLALGRHLHDLFEYITIYRDTADLEDVRQGIEEWAEEKLFEDLEGGGERKDPELMLQVAEAFSNLWDFSARHGWWVGMDAHPRNWGIDDAENLVLLDFGLGIL